LRDANKPLKNAHWFVEYFNPLDYIRWVFVWRKTMDKKPKNALKFEEQVNKFKKRNLVIDSDEYAKKLLTELNYYRFTSYMIDYKIDSENYKVGTNICEIKSIYDFDRELRFILFRMIEQIEISFRTYIAYTLGNKYGPMGYMDDENFKDKKYHSRFIDDVNKNIKWNDEKKFINHHIKYYGGSIPIWVVIEVLNFSILSKLYKNMKVNDKKYISNNLVDRVNYKVIDNWLHVLSLLRNDCAHHNRVYTNDLKPISILDKYKKDKYDERSIFAYLLAMKHLSKSKIEWTRNILSIKRLIEFYFEVIDLDKLGFHDNWFEVLSK